MLKPAQLRAKAADLPESIASEVLDFLEFVTARHEFETRRSTESIRQWRGAFKGRISSSTEFAAIKVDEIRFET